jgi:opacity protein-like surface antigen
MKKIVVTFLSVLGFYYSATAQTQPNAEFGVNAGLNAATTILGAYTGIGYRFGYNAALSGEYYFSERWGIKAKVIYDQKGWNNGLLSAFTGDYPTNFQFDYITVPLMANWHFGSTRNWYLNFGPYAGFLISARETKNNSDLKSATSSTDFGLASGIGIKFPVSDNAKLFLEVDYQDGFKDVYKDNSGTTTLNVRSSINIGITFR